MAGERQTEPHQAGVGPSPREALEALERADLRDRAEAAEARAENQAAEIVALLRSYANVHMTKALADLIEHKYIHGEKSSA